MAKIERRSVKWIAFITASIGLAFVLWQVSYPSHSDPKNIRYQMWKVGIARMDLDEACGTMTADPYANKLVLGKSRSQLEHEFGFLTTPENAGAYFHKAYEESSEGKKEVLFIRHSPWMVVFDNGKAPSLVLIKGV
ncbi:MAG: hypothetical protein ACREP9_04645 [Candidatus Dormibacteraceae bacterium]